MTILLKSLSQKEDFDRKPVETRCFRCVATNGATNKGSAATPIGSASAGTLTVAPLDKHGHDIQLSASGIVAKILQSRDSVI
jgi:hypothetical protein